MWRKLGNFIFKFFQDFMWSYLNCSWNSLTINKLSWSRLVSRTGGDPVLCSSEAGDWWSAAPTVADVSATAPTVAGLSASAPTVAVSSSFPTPDGGESGALRSLRLPTIRCKNQANILRHWEKAVIRCVLMCKYPWWYVIFKTSVKGTFNIF